MATLPPDVLARLDKVREIEIETTRKSGEHRRTIIWIVVDGDDVFVRSEYGNDGWWYRDITQRPSAVIQPFAPSTRPTRSQSTGAARPSGASTGRVDRST
jgi:hypothetical protein